MFWSGLERNFEGEKRIRKTKDNKRTITNRFLIPQLYSLKCFFFFLLIHDFQCSFEVNRMIANDCILHRKLLRKRRINSDLFLNIFLKRCKSYIFKKYVLWFRRVINIIVKYLNIKYLIFLIPNRFILRSNLWYESCIFLFYKEMWWGIIHQS